jgi:uncharacterized protein (DUF58 family)
MSYLFGYILALFVIAVLFRVDFFFYVLYLLFGVLVFSRLWTEQALRRLSLRRDYTDRAFPGERVTVQLEIENKGWLPVPWLRIHDSLPLQLKSPAFFQSALTLLPRERRQLAYELDCRKRGYYHLGPLVVTTGDLFGTGNQELQLLNNDTLTVYPRIVSLTEMGLPAQAPFGDLRTNQQIYEDPARLLGVRSYQSGDSLRHIHWTASAQTGQLQVKRFEPAISIESQILLNLNRDDYTAAHINSASELAIVTAASIANYLAGKRQSVGLTCNGLDPSLGPDDAIAFPAKKGRGQLMAILEALARVETSSHQPFGKVLQRSQLDLSWGATAVIITPDADDELLDRLLLIKRAGLHAVLVLMDPRTRFEETRQRTESVGIKAYQVWRDSDLDIWR